MSITTYETTIIDVDIGETPPCETSYAGQHCGKPSAARVVATCEREHSKRLFVCDECRTSIVLGMVVCPVCYAAGSVTEHS